MVRLGKRAMVVVPTFLTRTLSSRSSGNPQDNSSVAIGASLAVIGVLIIGTIVYYTLRMRRQSVNENTWYPLSSNATLVEPRHIASRITPFGTRRE
jgi:hypothetical protein